MRLLLDNHVLLWWLDNSPALFPEVEIQIAAPENIIYVSAATVWEIVIKSALGKLEIPDDWLDAVQEGGFRRLPITWTHALQVGRLPAIHRDPFDRLLIAQAISEDLVLVTGDIRLAAYPVSILQAGRREEAKGKRGRQS